MKNKINIGWIGAGFIGQVAHLRNFYLNKKVNIQAITELRPDLAKKVQQKYQIKKFYTDYKKMIVENNLDAVVAIVRRYHTASIALGVLKLGQNLFTEKPLAPSLSTGEKLVNLSKRKKLKYVIGNMRRFDSGITRAKKLFNKFLVTREIGELINFRFYCHAGNDYCNIDGDIKTKEKPPSKPTCEIYPSWIKNHQEGKDFEKFLNYFSHDINLIRFFFGNNLKISYAKKNKYYGNVIFELAKSTGSFEFSYHNSKIWKEGFEIYFSSGKISIELPPAFLRNQPSKIFIHNYRNREVKEIKSDWLWSFKVQADSFVETIANNKKNISDGEDTLKDLYIFEKIWKKF